MSDLELFKQFLLQASVSYEENSHQDYDGSVSISINPNSLSGLSNYESVFIVFDENGKFKCFEGWGD